MPYFFITLSIAFSIIREEPAPFAQQARIFLLSSLAICKPLSLNLSVDAGRPQPSGSSRT
jgi:hypothetical protein